MMLANSNGVSLREIVELIHQLLGPHERVIATKDEESFVLLREQDNTFSLTRCVKGQVGEQLEFFSISDSGELRVSSKQERHAGTDFLPDFIFPRPDRLDMKAALISMRENGVTPQSADAKAG